MRFADLTLVIAVIAIVIMMIIPLRTGILDVLLSLNITLSLTVLLFTMFTKEPLEFSVFPSMLLVLTLFRLALNVSSTRLILLHGYAGDVIGAFGNFVIGSEILVGFIVFFILIVIQFIVITKGSERVAEVAARFTLDAMPGKQMAIDADLNSGLIGDDEAKERRKKIQQEADFYGAMDGASKFVKGDAIAAIIITIVNVIGGLLKGVMQDGLPFDAALQQYTLLTVGDGLVSQIPALLISTATGIVVTRAASGGSMGEDLVQQLVRQPKTMLITASVMAFLGMVPGLPMLPFFVMSFGVGALGWRLKRETTIQLAEERIDSRATVDASKREAETVTELLRIDTLALELGFGLLPLAEGDDNELSVRISVIRRQLAMELGLIVPVIRVRDNIQLEPNKYVLRIKGLDVASGEVMLDSLMAMNPGIAQGDLPGLDTIEPAFGLPAKWIKETLREQAEANGYTVVDAPTVLATHLTEVIRRHAATLLNRQTVQDLIELVRERHPAIIEELVPNAMSLGQIQKVLHNLLSEQVSIRNLDTILETMADFILVTQDTDRLTEYVRQSLAREITNQYAPPSKTMLVVSLGPDAEQLIADSIQRTEAGSYLSIPPQQVQNMIEKVHELSQAILDKGQTPIILASPNTRVYLRRLIEGPLPQVVVLSYNELNPEQEVEVIGMVEVN